MTHMTVISPDRIMQLGSAFWASKTLLSAVELGLFTELATRGPQSVDTLRVRFRLHERGARDFLDALVSLGMLERDDQGRYGNTPETEQYLDRDKPSYMGGILEMFNRRLYPFWGRLTEALHSGAPQNESAGSGRDPFAAIYAHPDTLESFLGGMTGVSQPNARALAASFPWGDYQTFADIGCAQGALPVEIARVHEHLVGIGFDLPPVAPVFNRYVMAHRLQDRLRFQAGDFFKDPLPSVDVLVMGHILHDWGLPDKRMLLRKAYDALPVGGALVVYDAMIDDERRSNTFGLLMSLNMLIETPAGFDYTGQDCIGWMREAGFRTAVVRPLQGPYSMAVATK